MAESDNSPQSAKKPTFTGLTFEQRREHMRLFTAGLIELCAEIEQEQKLLVA
jgi:hypothetical protein